MKVTTEVTHEQRAGFRWDTGPWEWGDLGWWDTGLWGHGDTSCPLLPVQVVPGDELEGLSQENNGE